MTYAIDSRVPSGVVVDAKGNFVEVKGERRVKDVMVGGKPIDPNRTYGVATIDFLLDGGDGLAIAKNARELITADKTVIDVMLPYVRSLGASGTPLEYKTDGRVVVNKEEDAQ